MLMQQRTRRRPQRLRYVRSSGMGDVSALVIGVPRGASADELRSAGMAGMGASSLVNALTGGAAEKIEAKLARVELALKISTGAALFAALMTIVALRRR